MTKSAGTSPFALFNPDLLPGIPTDLAGRWLHAQQDALSAMRSMTDQWMERRRQGAEALGAAMAKLSACKDMSEVATVQQEWLAGAVDRMMAECTEAGAQATRLVQSMAPAAASPAAQPTGRAAKTAA